MLLSDARTKVRTLADDRNSDLFDDVALDSALTTAQYEAFLWACSTGTAVFSQEATVTPVAGVLDLSALRPLKIHGVAFSVGGYRTPLQPMNLGDFTAPYLVSTPVVVSYTARPAFPVSGAAPFVWGNGIACPPLDELLCCSAASTLKIFDNEQLKGLETRKAELRAAIQVLIKIPGWTALLMQGRIPCRARYCLNGADILLIGY